MKYELHQFCLAFRRANEQELAAIVADMQSGGYDREQPITLYEGKILDGSARDKAAGLASVEPTYTTFTGSEDEAIAFVLRRNKVRKHMSKGELDLAAARLVTAKRGGQPSNTNALKTNTEPTPYSFPVDIKTRKMVADASGRGIATLQKARTLLHRAAPNIIAMVEAGEIGTVTACDVIAHRSKEAQAQLTVADARNIGKTAKTKRREPASLKPAKSSKPISPWRLIRLKDLTEDDIGTERIPGQPVLLQPAYVQRLTEASIRVRGIAGRVEGCAGMILDIFDADITNLLAHVPVRGKKNGEERNYANETEKTMTLIAKHIDAAIDKLSALRERVTQGELANE